MICTKFLSASVAYVIMRALSQFLHTRVGSPRQMQAMSRSDVLEKLSKVNIQKYISCERGEKQMNLSAFDKYMAVFTGGGLQSAQKRDNDKCATCRL
ncbi:hypothetical protein BsWGS_01771 [Bradybaena similaris]